MPEADSRVDRVAQDLLACLYVTGKHSVDAFFENGLRKLASFRARSGKVVLMPLVNAMGGASHRDRSDLVPDLPKTSGRLLEKRGIERLTHVFYQRLSELGTFDLFCAPHLPGKIISHDSVPDCPLDGLSYQLRRFVPSHVLKHHDT